MESEIKKFYNNKSVFITGSSGFVGKILLLKLLLSCPNIGFIYVLMRSQNDSPSNKRLTSLLNSAPFSYVFNEEDIRKKKVVSIDGDITKPELGLSESDQQLLKENVSVVFHCAASVKFDAPLKESLDFNVMGTKRVIDICQQMKNISCFIHCSTAYSHCQLNQIDEKFYSIPIDPKVLLKLSQWLSSESLDQLTPHLLNGRPNTYTYTKALAEQLILEECKDFPVAVVRPAIVLNSELEPIPGWIDNVNGPAGITVLGGLGILRCVNWNYYAIAEFVPVDKVVNSLIAIGWSVACEKSEQNTPTVFNVVSSNANPITWGQFYEYSYNAAIESPSIRLVRPIIEPPKQTGPHPILNPIKSFFSHWMFAYFLDFILWVCGHRKMMVKITSKMHNAMKVMDYFTQNQWTFKSDNLNELWNRLNIEDKNEFNFDMSSIDWKSLGEKLHFGIRRHLLNESDDNIPKARKRMQRIIIAYLVFKLVLITFLAYFVIYWTPIWAFLSFFGRNLCNILSLICKQFHESGCVSSD